MEVERSANVKKKVSATHQDFRLLKNPFIKNRVINVCGFKYDMATGEYVIRDYNFGQNEANYANEMIKIWTPLKAQIVKIGSKWHLVAIE